MSHHAITIGNATLIAGDCRAVLATLPADSVHCVVTSPPYFWLRDYGTGTWAGGDPACEHGPDKRGGRFATPVSAKQASNTGSGTASTRDCPCGATRIDAQIGLEPTPGAYVAELVAVFRAVRRVLRPDGVCFLNLGDSYAGGKTGRDDNGGEDLARRAATYGTGTGEGREPTSGKQRPVPPGCKPKDLLMMPARVALALQADGWWLRSDIIWAKPNPMPESITDRPTSAHEHVFLLTKSARYFWDADAVSEPLAESTIRIHSSPNVQPRPGDWKVGHVGNGHSGLENGIVRPSRNIRNVWTIATEAYPDSHFATMPTALVERCIKAGCPEGGTVLDPFSGAGTTALVADRLRRHAIGIELSAAYIAMAADRLRSDVGLFAAPVVPAPEPPAPSQWVLL